MTDLDGIVEHYERLFDEDARLASPEGRVEVVRTRELLEPHLGGVRWVLDVGGGTGVHAAWLAERGCDVEVIDITPRHVAIARERGLAAQVGDARELPCADESVDLVLLLGPLYHLVERRERQLALLEARRVLRRGGVLAVAAISRFAGVLDMMRRSALTREVVDQFAPYVASGVARFPGGLAEVYFHRAFELADEVTDAGFDLLGVHGLEGPGWLLLLGEPSDALIDGVLEAARVTGDQDGVVEASSHLLALATRT